MLVLVEQRAFTTEEMIDAVETAVATKWQMIAEQEHPEIASVAAGMLSTIASSLAASKVGIGSERWQPRQGATCHALERRRRNGTSSMC